MFLTKSLPFPNNFSYQSLSDSFQTPVMQTCDKNESDRLKMAEILFSKQFSTEKLKKPSIEIDEWTLSELEYMKKIILNHNTIKTEIHEDIKEMEGNEKEFALNPLQGTTSSTGDTNSPIIKYKEAHKEEKRIGLYSKIERFRKIKKYKAKVRKRRLDHPISRKFGGRSKIAFEKHRKNGRFAKN